MAQSQKQENVLPAKKCILEEIGAHTKVIDIAISMVSIDVMISIRLVKNNLNIFELFIVIKNSTTE